MEITLKIDNLTEVNEIKEWFRKKLTDDSWIEDKKSYYNTHQHIMSYDIFDAYLCSEVINDFIDKQLMIDAPMFRLTLADIYKNVYNVLYEIYKTIDIDETEPDNDTLIEDCEVEEKVVYKNNKFMI